MFHVYFIKSKRNGKVYVGSTEKNPEIRLHEHNTGSNEWSKNNKPFDMLYFEDYSCKEDMLKRERFYKSGFGKLIKDSIIKTIEEHKFWGRSSVG